MSKYLVYELKKSLPLLIGITVVCSVLILSPILVDFSYWESYGASQLLGTISTMFGVLAAIIPIWVFKYKMRKRSLDLYYALPISHTKIIVVKFLLGLILVFVPYFVTYWLHVAVTLTSTAVLLHRYYAIHFLSTLIPIYIIYATAAFVFTRANNMLDGIIFMIFWALALPVVALLLDQLRDTDIEVKAFLIFAPLDDATCLYQNLLIGGGYVSNYDANSLATANIVAGYTLTALMGIGSTVGIILFERTAKAENCQQVSESPFGYKVMIPLFTACCMAFCFIPHYGIGLVFAIITLLASFLITILYKRKLAIGWKQFIIYSATVILGIILGIIFC